MAVEFAFRADEVPMAVELCRLADDIERLRRELRSAPLIVSGSKGQDAINPLRLELHRTSARFEALSRSLALPEDDADVVRARSWAGRNLAMARWGG